MRLSSPTTNKSMWLGMRAIAVTGEPTEARPPATWNHDPAQPADWVHVVDMIRRSAAVVNRSRSIPRLITVTVESGRTTRWLTSNQSDQPEPWSHQALHTRHRGRFAVDRLIVHLHAR